MVFGLNKTIVLCVMTFNSAHYIFCFKKEFFVLVLIQCKTTHNETGVVTGKV